jgi:hypothetical protein
MDVTVTDRGAPLTVCVPYYGRKVTVTTAPGKVSLETMTPSLARTANRELDLTLSKRPARFPHYPSESLNLRLEALTPAIFRYQWFV